MTLIPLLIRGVGMGGGTAAVAIPGDIVTLEVHVNRTPQLVVHANRTPQIEVHANRTVTLEVER